MLIREGKEKQLTVEQKSKLHEHRRNHGTPGIFARGADVRRGYWLPATVQDAQKAGLEVHSVKEFHLYRAGVQEEVGDNDRAELEFRLALIAEEKFI